MLTKIRKFIQANKYTLLLVFSLFLFAFDAEAENTAVFGALQGAGKNIWSGLRYIIPRAAMIGIACICIGGMFGNFNWKWLAAIAIGLFAIACYSGVEMYVTGGVSSSTDQALSGAD